VELARTHSLEKCTRAWTVAVRGKQDAKIFRNPFLLHFFA
jgi:hypothetical protein